MSERESLAEKILIYSMGILVVGILMGGVYSLPAMRVTRSNEPWYTLLLACGLTTTVTVFGLVFSISNAHILYAVLAANILLIVRRSLGKLDHNVERFGFVHAFSLLGCFWYVLLVDRINS